MASGLRYGFVLACSTAILFNACSQTGRGGSQPLADTSVTAWQDALIRGPVDPNSTGSKDDWNVGAIGQIQVGIYDPRSAERSLVQFSIPDGYTSRNIASATLRLTSWMWVKRDYSAEFPIHVHRLLRSWKQGSSSQDRPTSSAVDGVTGVERFWGAQDGNEDWNRRFIGLDDVDADSRAGSTAARPGGHIGAWEFDVTEMVKFWADNPDRNFGLLLVCDLTDTDRYPDYPVFRSSEYAGSGHEKPLLVIKAK